MRQFYEVTQKLKDTLIADDDVNVVTLGDASDYDLSKQSVYPLAHIIPGNVTLKGSTVGLDFTIVLMDRPYESKGDLRDVADPFHGVNDVQDVWNTQMAVADRLIERMRRGDLFSDLYQLDADATIEPFMDRGENVLAGWVLSFTVNAPSNVMCIPTSSTTISAPSGLAAAVSGTDIVLTWTDNADNETGYYVLRSTNPLTGYTTLATLGADATAYTDSAASVDTFYHYKVRAFNTETVSGFSNIATQYISSGACDDATATLNGSTITTIASGSSQAITLLDQNANNITSGYGSTDGSANVTVQIYNTSTPYKTGTTTSGLSGDDGDTERGNGSSFTVLSHNNPFGNTNRFTDELGGQTYANNIVIDWKSWSQSGESVLGWYRVAATVSGVANAISTAAAYSIGGFNTWLVPNLSEALSIVRTEGLGTSNGNPYDYSPLNLSGTGVAERIWTITPAPAYSGEYILITDWNNRLITDEISTQVNRKMIACRYFTLTELGL